jgi:hypothetical protein
MDSIRLAEAQRELLKHSWDTFVNDPPRLPGLSEDHLFGQPVFESLSYRCPSRYFGKDYRRRKLTTIL